MTEDKLKEQTKVLLDNAKELAENLNSMKGNLMGVLDDNQRDSINDFIGGLDKDGAAEFLEKSKDVKNTDARDFIENLLKNKR
jgi:hypothetical protein